MQTISVAYIFQGITVTFTVVVADAVNDTTITPKILIKPTFFIENIN